MEIQEIIVKALGSDMEAYTALNQKQNLFIPLTKEEEKKLKDFRERIFNEKNSSERQPKLDEFVAQATKLQQEFGFKMTDLVAALRGAGSTKGANIVGTFQFSDFDFKAVDSHGVEVKIDGKAPTEYTWDFSNSPKGRGWQTAFVAKIKEAGLEKAQNYFTPEFKAWLAETRDGKGPMINSKVLVNAQPFFKLFGVKGEIADDGTLNIVELRKNNTSTPTATTTPAAKKSATKKAA